MDVTKTYPYIEAKTYMNTRGLRVLRRQLRIIHRTLKRAIYTQIKTGNATFDDVRKAAIDSMCKLSQSGIIGSA